MSRFEAFSDVELAILWDALFYDDGVYYEPEHGTPEWGLCDEVVRMAQARGLAQEQLKALAYPS